MSARPAVDLVPLLIPLTVADRRWVVDNLRLAGAPLRETMWLGPELAAAKVERLLLDPDEPCRHDGRWIDQTQLDDVQRRRCCVDCGHEWFVPR